MAEPFYATAVLLMAAALPPALIDLTGAYFEAWKATEGQPAAGHTRERRLRAKADVHRPARND